ncbi:MAG: filamentous hemagglutinin N-terminal domain-containing protein [Leptolyngbya sp. SIO3F4]|nr:filamentous hemagglutinin N-terminal domain-containing protein [Leptolyngbya sp. SIO3F4]
MLFRNHTLAGTIVLLSVLTLPAVAQITPDETLGNEGSFLTEGVDVRGDLADLVEGGATRGGNLFHSFLEFNVYEGQRVYFANPVGIESILGRVTGDNPSNILGLLGVDGGADLFLLNPNGIVFGEGATFDIEGSFYGTTGDAVELGEDGVFSAVEPGSSRLLRVNPSVLLGNYLTADSGDIESRGQLAVLGDLVLAGNGLDLQGQVAAGGDLTLLGLDGVRIRDTAETPFVGFAGGDLLVQGNQQVDIVALSHPDSGLFSYGDMVLRSEAPVGGDAHYWSGSSFRIENLAESLGTLYSPNDPVIFSRGDVSFDAYSGASLHIFAGGSVDIPFGIEVIGPDFVTGFSENVELSDGTIVFIRGSLVPTIDIRAGVDPVLISGEGATGTGFIFNPVPNLGTPDLTSVPTGSDIRIGTINVNSVIPNGSVLLTNMYRSNPLLPDGSITVVDEQNVSQGFAIRAPSLQGEGASVFIDSREDIIIDGSISASSTVASAGNVRLIAKDDILLSTSMVNDPLNPLNLSIQSTGPISGSINLTSGQDILIVDSGIASNSLAATLVDPNDVIQSGDITLNANSLTLRNSPVTASSDGSVNAGNINLQVIDSLNLEGSASRLESNTQAPSGLDIFYGNAGDINVQAGSLIVDSGAISSSTFNAGSTGRINVQFDEIFTLQNTASIFSNIEQGSTGNGKGISIQSESGSLIIIRGSQIQSLLSEANFGQPAAQGNAGPIEIDIGGEITLGGISNDTPSSISTITQPGTVGNAGSILVRADSLRILGQGTPQIFDGTISTDIFGTGNAGEIEIELDGALEISGLGAGLRSGVSTGGEGDSGDIKIMADSLLLDEISIIAATHGGVGIGTAGDISIHVKNDLTLRDSSIQTFLGEDVQGRSGNVDISASTIVAENADISTTALNGNSGSIIISAEEVLLRQDSDVTTTTFTGATDAGNITFLRGFVFAFDDSDILAIAADEDEEGFGGRGGDIDFTQTTAFFGENPIFDGPLPIDGNDRVDVNALGGTQSGTISVPDVSFIEDNLNELSGEFVDTATLTAGSCIVNTDDNIGSFVVTGGEGLPQQPGTAPMAIYPTNNIQSPAESTATSDIQEAHGAYQLADGRLVLSHECERAEYR